jgi:adenine-specific DNA-methyltransferase
MDKLKMHSPDITQQNIHKLLELFPNCKTEKQDGNGELSIWVDFDLLKQELSKNIVEGPKERYQLNWPGKKEALLMANAPIAKTLRPCREESIDFDTTENLFIEGDNLDALKLLQETYLGKVKMIYIDPPYNTGNDFIYTDNFAESTDEYLQESGQKDKGGNRLVANTESNGRFHSDWLSMMYSRLRLARNLLGDDGVIFISIDDNEQSSIRKLCDEIFGEEQFISQLVWEKKKKGTFLSKSITSVKEYVFVYAKIRSSFRGLIGEINHAQETYPCVNASNKREIRNIPAGISSKYRERNYFLAAGSKISASTMDLILHSDLVIKNGLLAEELIIEGNWRYRSDLMVEFARNDELYITQDLYLRRIVSEPREKTLKDLLPRVGSSKDASHKMIDTNNLFSDGWGSNEDGEEEVRLLLEGKAIMDFPKPRKLIEKLCASIRDKDALVLDFFAGSATSAHAVMDLNSIDGGNRKFIMVQLPEVCDEQSEAFKAGYKSIAEISKERIRRAGLKIKEEKPDVIDLDIGFRVLKIDSNNMNEVHYTPDSVSKGDLFNQIEHIKTDRSSEDLLFQVMLDWGVDLSLPIRKETIEGKEVYFVNDDDLVACFDKSIDEVLIKALAAKAPLRVVFRDDGFVSDSVKINVEQIFKQLTPATDIKAI